MIKRTSRCLVISSAFITLDTMAPAFGGNASTDAALKTVLDSTKSRESQLEPLVRLPIVVQNYYTAKLSEPKTIPRVFAEGDQPWESGYIRFDRLPSNQA